VTQRATHRTAGIVLAAGRGTRFGGGKMLAPIDGLPMLQHVLNVAADAGLDPIVVVLGNDAEQIGAAIKWRNELRVRNDHPKRGISGSVKVGLESISESDRALILLGDQPLLTPDQIRTIISPDHDSTRPIAVPRYSDGRLGSPVLLERGAWALAAGLTGDRGMSQLFDSHADQIRYVELPGDNPDIDTRADLAAVSRGGEPGRSGHTEAAGRRKP